MSKRLRERRLSRARAARAEKPAPPPDPAEKFSEKAHDLNAVRKSVDDAAAVSAGFWLSYLFVLLYIGIAAGGVTHKDLLLESPVKLPFLGVDLPLVAFFVLAPIIFIMSHAYTLVHFVMLGAKVGVFDAELRAQHGDAPEAREGLRRQLPSNIFVQFLAGPEDIRKGGLGLILKAIAWISLVIGPVLLLLLIQVQFLPYHLEAITSVQCFAVIADVILVWALWPAVLNSRSDIKWPRLRRHLFLTLASFVPIGFAFFFSSSTVGLKLDHFDALVAAKIDDPKKLDSIKHTLVLAGRNLENASFIGADLRKVDLTGAHLKGVSLEKAQLQGAWLIGAELQGATLENAHLQDASLEKARLQGATLENAHLQGASFASAELQGASLNSAQLQGVSLFKAQLQGASLIGAELQGAVLDKAQLQGALLNGANLQGASLAGAQLSGASLMLAQLQGASLERAKLAGAELDSAFVWRARFSLDSIEAVTNQGIVWDSEYLHKLMVRPVPWTLPNYLELKKKIAEEVGTGPREDLIGNFMSAFLSVYSPLVGPLPPPFGRNEALKRIEILDPNNPFKFEAEVAKWKMKIEAKAVGLDDYRKALAGELKTLVCSGDADAIYVVRGVLKQGNGTIVKFAGAQAPGLVEAIVQPKGAQDCPVSAALTEQEKTDLRKLAKEASGAH